MDGGRGRPGVRPAADRGRRSDRRHQNDTVYALSASGGAVRWSRHLASRSRPGCRAATSALRHHRHPGGRRGHAGALGRDLHQPAYQHTLWALTWPPDGRCWQRPIDVSGSDPAGPAAARCADAARLPGVRAVRRPVRRLLGLQGTRGGSVRGRFRPVGRLHHRQPPRRASGPRPGNPYATTASTSPPATACRPTRSTTPTACCGSARPCRPGPFHPGQFPALSSRRQGPRFDGPGAAAGRPGLPDRQAGDWLRPERRPARRDRWRTHLRHVCEGGFGGDAVDGSTVVFSCYTSLRAVQITPDGAGPRLASVCR